ncbi:MAG: bifunctional diguanylate cyclase/phosphodiesterase [Chloroflexota bacterium]
MDDDQRRFEAELAAADSLRLVRLRLWAALLVMFTIPIAIATPVLYGLAIGNGSPMVLPTILIAGASMVLGVVTVWLARRVLEPAERLDQARIWLGEAYRRAREESLRDPLTGLGNHRAFQDELDRQIASAERYGTDVAVALIDLDDFARINDLGGHAVGDATLQAVASLLSHALRKSDGVFRIGGDEFAVLLPHTNADGAELTTRRILSSALVMAASPVVPAGISFSAGISAYPQLASDRSMLYRQSASALAWAKRHGRTAVTIHDPARYPAGSLDRPASELSALVERVVSLRPLRAVFQPIFAVDDGRPVGYEALIRPFPESGFADPGSLFLAAEMSGRTMDLDLACIETAVTTAAELGLAGYISLNISPRTLESVDFSVGHLATILRGHEIDPSRVVVELTERETIEDLPRLQANVAGLRRLGMRIAADDVGAGNAGLRLLSQIRFDIVKIDVSLIQGGVHQATSLEVVRTIRDLAARTRSTVVAEGVETADQLRICRDLGLSAAQGYLLGRPSAEPPRDALDLDQILADDPWAMLNRSKVPA